MNITKSFSLASGNINGNAWLIECFISRNGTILNSGRLALRPVRHLKAFILIQGYETGWGWHISAVVKSTGGFNNKSTLTFQPQAGDYKYKIRGNDRKWVKRHIPASFRMKYPENHHDWFNGGILHLVTLKEHKDIHKALKQEKEKYNLKEESRKAQ